MMLPTENQYTITVKSFHSKFCHNMYTVSLKLLNSSLEKLKFKNIQLPYNERYHLYSEMTTYIDETVQHRF